MGAKKGGAARDFEAGDGSRTKEAGLPCSLVDTKIVLIVSGGSVGTDILIVASGGTASLDGLIDNI